MLDQESISFQALSHHLFHLFVFSYRLSQPDQVSCSRHGTASSAAPGPRIQGSGPSGGNHQDVGFDSSTGCFCRRQGVDEALGSVSI